METRIEGQVRYLFDPEKIAALHSHSTPNEGARMMHHGGSGGLVAPLTHKFNFSGSEPKQCSPIQIYDASQAGRPLVRARGNNLASDPGVDICFNSLKRVDITARQVLRKHPVNSPARLIRGDIRDTSIPDNAAWVPARQKMIYGTADPIYYTSDFHEAPDISYHEMGHAVVEYAGGLTYQDQSGALDESLADIFAIMVKHHYHRHTPNVGNWCIAPGFMNGAPGQDALRRFDNPGSAHWIAHGGVVLMEDTQVRHMDDYLVTHHDLGGVHTNSGIPNHAFYHASIDSGYPTYERTGLIWFKAMEKSTPDVSFATFAAHTIRSAHDLFPGNGNIANIVARSWDRVGVDYRSAFEQPGDAFCQVGLTALMGSSAFCLALMASASELSYDGMKKSLACAEVVAKAGGTALAVGATTWKATSRLLIDKRLWTLGVHTI